MYYLGIKLNSSIFEVFVLSDRFITKFLKSKTQIGFILRINFNKIFAMKTRLFKLKVIAYTQ